MDNENPYASPSPVHPQPNSKVSPAQDYSPRWILLKCFLGTMFSGGLFGIIAGALGLVVGLIIAGIVGFCLFLVALIPTVFAKSRNQVVRICVMTGAMTGFISIWMLSGFDLFAFQQLQFVLVAGLAAIVGALGSFLASLVR